MNTRARSFSPDNLLGTPLSPILEHDALPQTDSHNILNTESTVFVGQFDNSPDHRQRYLTKIITRQLSIQLTPVGGKWSKYVLGRQPSNIRSKLPESDGDDTSSKLAGYRFCTWKNET